MIRSKEFKQIAAKYGAPDLDIDLVEMTPEDAQMILDTHNTKNRDMPMSYADELAAEDKSGRWVINGDTISFDVSGTLIDGQNRLRKIVILNKPEACIVVKGLPMEAFLVKDNGRNRSAATGLALSGVQKSLSSKLASAVRLVHAYDKQSLWSSQASKMSNYETVELVKTRYTNLAASVTLTRNMNNATWTPHHIIAAAHFIAARIDKTSADAFFTQLKTKTGFSSRSPGLALLNRLQDYDMKMKKAGGKKVGYKMLNVYIKAWNAYRQGKDITSRSLEFPIFPADYVKAV
jgi:hypothetical protein